MIRIPGDIDLALQFSNTGVNSKERIKNGVPQAKTWQKKWQISISISKMKSFHYLQYLYSEYCHHLCCCYPKVCAIMPSGRHNVYIVLGKIQGIQKWKLYLIYPSNITSAYASGKKRVMVKENNGCHGPSALRQWIIWKGSEDLMSIQYQDNVQKQLHFTKKSLLSKD